MQNAPTVMASSWKEREGGREGGEEGKEGQEKTEGGREVQGEEGREVYLFHKIILQTLSNIKSSTHCPVSYDVAGGAVIVVTWQITRGLYCTLTIEEADIWEGHIDCKWSTKVIVVSFQFLHKANDQ